MIRTAVLLVLLSAVPAAGAAGETDVIRRDIDLHAGFLSSPELGDRVPGEPGLDVAARYLAEELRRFGFAPGGGRGGWEVPTAVVMTPRPEVCLLVLRGREGTRKFVPVRDYLPQPVGGAGTVVAPAIFVAGAADLSNSVRGRIVLLFGADPGTVAAAAARGAAAILVARDPRRDTVDRVTFADGRIATGDVRDRGTEFLFTNRATGIVTRLTKEEVREIELDLPPGPPGRAAGEVATPRPLPVPALGVSVEAAAAILGADPAEVLAGVEAGVRPRVSPATGGTIRLAVPGEKRRVTLRTVRARRPGTDRRAARTAVLVRMRYDGVDDAAAAGLALAAEILRGKAGVRPVVLQFAPGGSDAVPLGVILVTHSGDRRVRKVPVGRPGERAAAVAAVRVAARIVKTLANVPLPKAAPRSVPPGAKPTPPPPPKGTVAAARRARLAGRLDEADRELAAALAKSPNDAAVLTERGRVLIAKKNWEAALAEVEKIEAISKTDGRAEHLRFEVYEARGDDEEAGAALFRAVGAEYPEAMIDWAIRLPLSQAGAMQAARTVLRKLVTTAPETVWGKFAAGIHLYNRRDLAGAERYLGETVKLDPLLGSAWFWRGKVRSELGRDPTEAAKDFDRAAAFGFDLPSVKFERGLCRLRAKMYTLAIREFTAYLAEVPTDSAAIYNIACAHALMRNVDEALDWLGRSIEAGFDDPDHARNDPDLESIRDHPRFEALLKSRRTD